MIQLHDFSIGYRGTFLIENAAATFPGGSLTALIGRNGTGKSTMLRAIAGLNRNYRGTITIDSTDTRTLTPAAMSRRLAIVTTRRIHIDNYSCRDVVAAGRAPYTNHIGLLSDDDMAIVDRAIEMTGVCNYSSRSIATLSDGEAQRVMVARAIAQQTPAIILDEPTSFLDLPSRRSLATLLRSLATDAGKCIIFSTHELDIALEFATHISLIDSNRIITLPTPQMIESRYINRIFN